MPIITWNALISSSLGAFVIFVIPNILNVGSTSANFIELGQQTGTLLRLIRESWNKPFQIRKIFTSIVGFVVATALALWLSLFNVQVGTVSFNALTSALGFVSILFSLSVVGQRIGHGQSRFDAVRGIQGLVILFLIAIILTLIPKANAFSLPAKIPHGDVTIKVFPVSSNTSLSSGTTIESPTSTTIPISFATQPSLPTATLVPTSTATSVSQVQPTHVPPLPPTSTPKPTPTYTPVPKPLNVLITQPTNGAAIPFYTTTTLIGNASDPNNGANLTGSDLRWVATQGSVSIIMGQGVTCNFAFNGAIWNAGNATITLYASDPANGLTNQTQITISLYYAT